MMGKKVLSSLLVAAFALIATGCGTLLKPERIGKRASDRIDPSIMILDCCGFLFGVIPGVVALVLDFNNKTIYFSANETSSIPGSVENMQAIKVGEMSKEEIASAVSKALGKEVKFSEIQFAAR